MIIGITDRHLLENEDMFFDRVLGLIESPLQYVILREKDWDGEKMTGFLLQLMGKSDQTCRKIVVHSQVSAARHLGLTYVHLPENRIAEPQKSHTKYSYSVRSLDALRQLKDVPSLFTLISPVAETTCKPGCDRLTDETLTEALTMSQAPLVALGGIDYQVAERLKTLGFKHIALRSGLMTAQDLDAFLAPYIALGF